MLLERIDCSFWEATSGGKRTIAKDPYLYPIKPFDSLALVKYSRIVSSCVQVLTQMNFVGDLKSEGVLNSATRKLPTNMKTKWLTYTRQNATCYMASGAGRGSSSAVEATWSDAFGSGSGAGWAEEVQTGAL